MKKGINPANYPTDLSPNPDFTGSDSYTYTACDSESACDTSTVIVIIGAVNDFPAATDDSASTPEDTIPVLENDSNVEVQTPTVQSIDSGPSNGSATINPDGTTAYSPNPDFTGSDSYTYTACDSESACDTATVIVIIEPVNDFPDATDDSTSTPEDTPVDIAVLINDSDPEGDDLTVTVPSQPPNGNVMSRCVFTTTNTLKSLRSLLLLVQVQGQVRSQPVNRRLSPVQCLQALLSTTNPMTHRSFRNK